MGKLSAKRNPPFDTLTAAEPMVDRNTIRPISGVLKPFFVYQSFPTQPGASPSKDGVHLDKYFFEESSLETSTGRRRYEKIMWKFCHEH